MGAPGGRPEPGQYDTKYLVSQPSFVSDYSVADNAAVPTRPENPPRSAFAAAARSLLRNLRRRGALRPGSLIVTLFGDAIAPRGGVVALSSLIRAGALFGVTERHVRTSVGRLAQDGWIEAQRQGRVSFYRLSEAGRRRFAEATQRIYFSADTAGDGAQRTRADDGRDGRWTLVALLPGMRSNRERIRREMALLGFGQVQPGLLASPTRDTEDTLAALRELGVVDEVFVTSATAASGAAGERIARLAWNLDEIDRRYEAFMRLFAPVNDAALAEQEIAPDAAFIVRTLLIHEYRKTHLRDPMLPARMLPADWSGRQAGDLCAQLYATLFHAAERYVSTFMRAADGALPDPRADTYRRFGGLPGPGAQAGAGRGK